MRTLALFPFALPLLLAGTLRWSPEGQEPSPAGVATIELAVIVHPDNPVSNLDFADLRAYMRLDREYWPSEQKCVLYLRPRQSVEQQLLQAQVYKMNADQLKKYWYGKVFRGDISAKPSVAPTARAAGVLVGKSVGALAIVLSTEVPDGVKVLLIDGRKPGDQGYPLAGETDSSPASSTTGS
ncbi:MAG TPA: hypothetical protein VGC54_03560 [Planctomycetota bacterium]